MRIDSAILSNAIITASSENPIVSGSAQVDITNTTGYSTFSSSIKTYADAKVAGLVDSAPGTLDTLNELAAALGDDANLSASIATSIGNRLLTSVHNTYSASADAHLDANISSLSGSAHTRRNQQISALSASAHTRREEISASLDATIDALDTLGISTDTERGALSSSAHTQRVALNSAQTTANNTLSSSIATALRAEYVAGDAAFLTSASIGATINDNAVKLSGIESGATADQSDSEIKTAYENNSDTNAFTDALLSKLNAIEASADVTDTANVTSAGALMDSEVTNLAQVKAFDSSDYIASASNGAKLNGIESGADVTDATNVAAAGALMSSSLGEQINDDSVKLSGIESGADVTDTTNVVAALTAGSNISISAGGEISSTDTNTQLSNEQVQDIVGAMVTGNTESGITVTYQDGDGTIDFSVASQTDQNFTNADHTKLDGIEASADVTDATNVQAAGAVMDSELTNESAVKAINQGLTTTSDVTFADLLVTGDLTVQGSRTELQVTSLNVEDLNITVASGSSNSSAADGAGLTIAGANESLTWDHGNSRFNFSDDLHVVGNITVSGNVDGRDVATDGSKLDGIESGADVTDTTNVVAALTAGTNISIAGDGTISATDTDTNTFRTVQADGSAIGATETLNLIGGTNVTLSESNGAITIAATDTDTNTFRTVVAGGNTLGGSETLTLSAGSNVSISESGGTVTISSTDTDTNTFRTVTAGGNTLGGSETLAFAAGSNVTITESGGTVTIASTDTDTNTQLSDEQVQDIVGAMVTGNTESGITVTYQDGDGTIDFSVASQTDENFTTTLKNKLDAIEASADVTDTTNVVAALTAGSNISISAGGEISATDTNTQATRNSLGIDTDDNVAFEGLMVGQASGATANTIRCVGDIVAYYSDDRLKNKIGNLEDALSKVNSLNGFTYTPNEAALALGVDQDEVRVGVSAQEVQAVLPEAVKDAPVENTEGYLTVQYEKIVPLLVEAIKELSAKVEELSK